MTIFWKGLLHTRKDFQDRYFMWCAQMGWSWVAAEFELSLSLTQFNILAFLCLDSIWLNPGFEKIWMLTHLASKVLLTQAPMAGNSLAELLFHLSTIVLTGWGSHPMTLIPRTEARDARVDPIPITNPQACRACGVRAVWVPFVGGVALIWPNKHDLNRNRQLAFKV